MSRAYDFSIQKKRLIDADELRNLLIDVLNVIDRNPKMDVYDLNFAAACVSLCKMIDDAPTIDQESLRPAGKWVPAHKAKIVNGHRLFADGFECSRCHKGHSGRSYCEECGARMEG